jgi:hypothetical protein
LSVSRLKTLEEMRGSEVTSVLEVKSCSSRDG